MAKKPKSLFANLYDAANKLRGNVEAANYKHIVLNLFFLKFVNDKFEERKQQLISEGKEKYINNPLFYGSENIFFLPTEARWLEIIEKSRDKSLCFYIDVAFQALEDAHPQKLKGALPKKYFSQSGLEDSKIRSLWNVIEKIDSKEDRDIFGKIYQYFLRQFAADEGEGAGEFYTPETVVKLIVSLIEPYSGTVYDPCCGSGGMFVQSVEFIKQHRGSQKEISIYGQEFAITTYKLAKINLAIRGIEADFGEAANTFTNDQHPNLKANYIMANPPFNQKDWRSEESLKDDPRWHGYEVPPASNANYAWVLHMVDKLSQNGVAAFLLANGALAERGKEYEIRKQLIKNDLVEAIILLPRKMFFNTDISATLWIVNRNKKHRIINHKEITKEFRDRTNEILFMDLRDVGSPFEKKFKAFEQEDINLISNTYHSWKSINKDTEYQDQKGFCKSVSFKEIEDKDFSLVPNEYIEFNDIRETINWNEEIKNISKELTVLFEKEDDLKKQVKEILRNFKS